MNKIRRYVRYVSVFFEILYSRACIFLKINKDATVIPEGHYCYVIDEEKNKLEPIDGYWIKTCKYYRSIGNGYAGCTYCGYIGWDICLSDQCKMCGENYGKLE